MDLEKEKKDRNYKLSDRNIRQQSIVSMHDNVSEKAIRKNSNPINLNKYMLEDQQRIEDLADIKESVHSSKLSLF